MQFNKRVQDLSQVFERTWNVNKNNQERESFLEQRKAYFKKIHNISDDAEQRKADRRREMLRANSVGGQVQNLNERMNNMNGSQRIDRMNSFKSNFK